MPAGIVKKWLAEKGLGWIKPDDGGDDLFVNVTNIEGDHLEKGDAVIYETVWNNRIVEYRCSTCSLVRRRRHGRTEQVGVGGGNKPGCETSELAPGCGAQFCLFKAEDNTLANFTDAGAMYTTNETFGLVDGNIVWQPTNTSANMMECPDFFPLGPDGKYILIGSVYKTNQWWVGTVAGNPPRFTPDNVGIMDYGNGCALSREH